jgi:hypothetical protein
VVLRERDGYGPQCFEECYEGDHSHSGGGIHYARAVALKVLDRHRHLGGRGKRVEGGERREKLREGRYKREKEDIREREVGSEGEGKGARVRGYHDR